MRMSSMYQCHASLWRGYIEGSTFSIISPLGSSLSQPAGMKDLIQKMRISSMYLCHAGLWHGYIEGSSSWIIFPLGTSLFFLPTPRNKLAYDGAHADPIAAP